MIKLNQQWYRWIITKYGSWEPKYRKLIRNKKRRGEAEKKNNKWLHRMFIQYKIFKKEFKQNKNQRKFKKRNKKLSNI